MSMQTRLEPRGFNCINGKFSGTAGQLFHKEHSEPLNETDVRQKIPTAGMFSAQAVQDGWIWIAQSMGTEQVHFQRVENPSTVSGGI